MLGGKACILCGECFLVDGNNGDWSNWSACKQSCGGGFHRRARHCNIYNCKGPSHETRGCSNDFCKGLFTTTLQMYSNHNFKIHISYVQASVS